MVKNIKRIMTIFICIIIFSANVVSASNEEAKTRFIFTDIIIDIFRGEEIFDSDIYEVSEEEKQKNNIIVTILGIGLTVYWIVLLIVFEKEDENEYKTYQKRDDMDLFEKYNPMLAGALAQNRQVLPRDVTAVILNLINKKAINVRMVPTSKGKELYTYMISENKAEIHKLDEIERFVLNWIFNFYEDDEIDLIKKLKELSTKKDFSKNIKKLNKMTQHKLNQLGGNICKVPLFLRITNSFLIIISILISVTHILNNGLNIHIYTSTILIALFVLIFIIAVLPAIAATIHLILLMTLLIKKYLKRKIENYNGKQILSTSILLILTMVIMIGLVYLVLPQKYICLDLFIIFMSILIIKTDHLMIKNDEIIMDDYYALQAMEKRIEEYSLIKDHQINYIKLWDEYLVYAVAFGIPIQIVDKLSSTYREDEDIRYMLKCEALYYLSKAYLEVMWGMEFKNKKSIFSLDELL